MIFVILYLDYQYKTPIQTRFKNIAHYIEAAYNKPDKCFQSTFEFTS
jgi:hypothetical protein